jgi:DNA-binding transcriptional regulator GbsR (MarR family)
MVSQLSELEEESIDYFVSFVQILGLPKSIGQIYGLMFVSPEPMAMDHVIERLEISKGSASQGLATLKGLGAILPVQIEGDRRDHFQADLQVSRIVNHFFEERLEPRLENGAQRLDRMIALAEAGDDSEESETLSRLQALKKWQSRGKKAIPFIKQFLKS